MIKCIVETDSKSGNFDVILQLVMLLWSYFSVVLTDPGCVPPNWRPAMDEERGEADPLNGSEFNGLQPDLSNQRIRYCRKCNQLKPPRCHHCSVCVFFIHQNCPFLSWFANIIVIIDDQFHLNFVVSGGSCVLKMDHHCVWVVNCVGALNYKYFLLFLVCLLYFRISFSYILCILGPTCFIRLSFKKFLFSNLLWKHKLSCGVFLFALTFGPICIDYSNTGYDCNSWDVGVISCFFGIPLIMILNLNAVLHIPWDESCDFGLIATFHNLL